MVRKSITCISLLFIGCGISYFGIDYQNQEIDKQENTMLISKYFEKKKLPESKKKISSKKEYVAVLEIPKIKLKRGLYSITNPKSKLDKNIIFLDKSDMPNKKNSRVIIVGHSGTSNKAYFHNLYKLKYKDTIILYYDNVKYTYKVSDIYDIIKSGTLALESNQDKKTLTLVTCKGNNKQLVIISTLMKEEKL